MLYEQPFEIRGAKIPLFALNGAYADLLGGNLDTSLYSPWSDVIEQIRASGANNVTLMVSAGVMRNASDSAFDLTLSVNPDLQAVRQLASLVHASGMNVTLDLFPHVANVISGDASQIGADRPYPSDPHEWLRNFGESVLQWARFADEIGATTFIPFSDTTQHLFRDTTLTDEWLTLIDKIRQNFSGDLSTSWWTPGYGDSISAIPEVIIETLDYLGIGFFPNLTLDNQASTQALTDAYHHDASGNDLLAFLQGLCATYNKPVWISDKAFHSFDGAAFDEGRIFDNSIVLTQDLDEQARLYDSFLMAMAREGGEWFQGVSFQSFNNLNDDSTFLHRFTNGPLSESPQGKPAMGVLADWFNGLRQSAGLFINGSDRGNQLGGGYLHDTISGGLGDDTLQGFAGDDVLTGGPEKSSPINNYRVDISLRGVITQGVSPSVMVQTTAGETVLLASVSAIFDVGRSAEEQLGESTHLLFDVSNLSDISLVQTNWAFLDFSATGNRFVHVESATINGVPLDLSRDITYQSTNPSVLQIGGLDSVHGGEFRFGLSNVSVTPDLVTPTDHDAILGGTGQDTLIGGIGNDNIDGEGGVDIAVYSGTIFNYFITYNRALGTATITDHRTNADGTDTLKSIEQLQFSDKTFDLINLPIAGTPGYGKIESFLFDAAYYLLKNPDLVPTVTLATAYNNYKTFGAAAGDAPNAWFDATYYSNKWADLKSLNLDAATLFAHYNLYGVWEGRSAGTSFDKFDGTKYLKDNPDVAAYVDAYVADFLGSRSNGAIAHYVIYGTNEGRAAYDTEGLQIEQTILIGTQVG